jgi:hypothetical protein
MCATGQKRTGGCGHHYTADTLSRVTRPAKAGTTPAVIASECRRAHSDTQRTWGRARAQDRLPTDVRQQLLNAIYDGMPFRQAVRDLDLTPNQVWAWPGPMTSGRPR